MMGKTRFGSMFLFWGIVNYVFVFVLVARPIDAILPQSANLRNKFSRLPDTDFGDHEYAEYQDEEVKRKDQSLQAESHLSHGPVDISPHAFSSNQLDPNIQWDPKWPSNVTFGQASAVSIDPVGNIVVLHRGKRVWGSTTFDEDNRFDKQLGPIRQNTVVVLDKNGKKLAEWGKNMFYLPHGLTIDSAGNYWITDVAMHQVFKFNAEDVQNHVERLAKVRANQQNGENRVPNMNNLQPSLVLGTPFEPGNDVDHFCKPTAVAVHSNGDFFVSDGYCNSRIIKYNAKGEKISQWGRAWERTDKSQRLLDNAFSIPHALALAEDLNLILVADREHGRIVSFYSDTGYFHQEYKDPRIGPKVFSISYARNKTYLVNGPDTFAFNFHVRGYVLDMNSGEIVSQFGPNGDMDQPHDIAVTSDGREIYVADLNVKRVYKFVQRTNSTKMEIPEASSVSHPETAPLSETSSNEAVTLLLSILIATIILITLCLIMAVVLARCRKRGCLLTRKRMDWDSDRKDNFKLSALLEKRIKHKFRFFEKRPNTRDFNKLSNEPETSDDENCENHLTII